MTTTFTATLGSLPPNTAFTTRLTKRAGLVFSQPGEDGNEGDGVLVELPHPTIPSETILKRVHPGCVVDAEGE